MVGVERVRSGRMGGGCEHDEDGESKQADGEGTVSLGQYGRCKEIQTEGHPSLGPKMRSVMDASLPRIPYAQQYIRKAATSVYWILLRAHYLQTAALCPDS